METIEDFREAFDEIAGDASGLASTAQKDRWINEAPAQLDFYREMTATLTWDAGQVEATLPGDFYRLRHIRAVAFNEGVELYPSDVLFPLDTLFPGPTASEWAGSTPPHHRIWAGKIHFTCQPIDIEAGALTMEYLAHWPRISVGTPSVMSETANHASLSWALYRFFARLSGSRAEYRRYATLLGANGVDIDELLDLSQSHLDAFDAARSKLETPSEPVYYYDC